LKSFMRNQQPNPSVQAVRSDKRFDALIKQEMIEHKHIISCHNKEMQTLRDSLVLAMEKFESLSKYGLEQIDNIKESYDKRVSNLTDKVLSHELIICDQNKTINYLHQQLNDFHIAYSSKNETDKIKHSLGAQVQEASTSHINAFQDCQREFKILFDSLKDYSIQLRCDMDQKFSQLTDKVESGLSISRIDKDGVLNRIRVYEKTVFIIEKKLENIYTLIERINKNREGLCHKPE